MYYEIYQQIFSRYKNKIFVHGKTIEKNIASIREACDLRNVLMINYSRSYLPSKYSDVLTQPDELVFTWGDPLQNHYDKKINCIKYFVTSLPFFHFQNRSEKLSISNEKIISVFDSKCNIKGSMDPINYLQTYNFLFDYTLRNKDIFLIIKIKYNFLEKAFLQRFSHKVNELKKRGKLKILSNSYMNNFAIHNKSFLTIGISTLSTSVESLYFGTDSLCLAENSYQDEFLSKLNKIYPIAFKKYHDFKKNFLKKIYLKTKENNSKKIKNLKEFLFYNKFNTSSFQIIDQYLKDFQEKIPKKQQIERLLINDNQHN